MPWENVNLDSSYIENVLRSRGIDSILRISSIIHQSCGEIEFEINKN